MRSDAPAIVLTTSIALLLGLTACQQPAPAPDSVSALPSDIVGDDAGDAVVSRASLSADGSTISAAGYVSGVTEDGRTCTFLFSTASGTLELTSTSISDATTTMCPEVAAPAATLPSGTVTVVLTYTIDTTTLTSEPLALEIP